MQVAPSPVGSADHGWISPPWGSAFGLFAANAFSHVVPVKVNALCRWEGCQKSGRSNSGLRENLCLAAG